MDTGILKEVLSWVVAGGGAMAATHFLMEKIPPLVNLGSEGKRYVSLALAATIACLVFLGAIGLEYYPSPETTKGWIEALFSVAFVATVGSQAIHGRTQLRN